ncbi:MAG: glycosyltransferase [Polyangiales bacterium]
MLRSHRIDAKAGQASPMSLLLLAASVAIHLLMMGAFVLAMARRRAAEISRGPRVSILKPLAGADEDLAENLASFAAVDYPSFEILLGVADANDPAVPVARAFVARTPNARLIFTDPHAATNPKVAQLIGLERVATGEVLVISDSNVRVSPSYLFDLVSELRDDVGIVSGVVVGSGERSIGAALENLHLASAIAPGVIASRVLSDKPLTVGKSMAMRRRDLWKIGGFAAVGGVLAEDHVLGRRFREAGFGVAIALSPIENRNVACSITRTLERHTRWAKMRRAIVPLAFWFEPLLEPVVIAFAALAIYPTESRAALFFGVVVLRISSAALATSLLRRRMRVRHLVLEPLRAFAIFTCWLRAAFSRRVEWRGHTFALGVDSKLIPVEPLAVRALAP